MPEDTEIKRHPLLAIKRGLDIVAAGGGLFFLSPLIFVLSILVLIKHGAPIFFTQDRPGLGGKVFRLYKFRSMNDKRSKNGTLLPDSQRLTKFGKFLRSTSLDELPELYNVFRGDMSLVGPRPLLVQYLPLYSSEQARRHAMRPGITGWAQVHGRNALSWREKFKLDVWYVDHWSLLLDLRILLKTVTAVLRREGIGEGTEPFTGNEIKLE
ncbi:MAG TPA: sugar transferase [Bellilinea sp.]|nr:sugar transferase [Bellilinea sp.]